MWATFSASLSLLEQGPGMINVFGLGSLEVIALAVCDWFSSSEESPWTPPVRTDHVLDTEQLLLMEWYSHIQRLRARRRPSRP